jgi:hypothetical protein
LPLFILKKTQQYEKENNEYSIYCSGSCNVKRRLRAAKAPFATTGSASTTCTGQIIISEQGFVRYPVPKFVISSSFQNHRGITK